MRNREAFEEWYKSEYPLDYEHYVNEQNIGVFTKLYLRCFASWSASAKREGYKLVPVDTHYRLDDDGNIVTKPCQKQPKPLHPSTLI